MHFRGYLLRISILCCFFYAENISAQNCLNEILLSKLYSGSDNIINGRKWVYEKRYLGSPLLMEGYWPKAEILYNGVHYTDIFMNYDVYNNEIIIFYPEKSKEKYVVISKDNLVEFSFTDSVLNSKHRFEYIELPGIRGKALYENVSVGKTSVFIKPVKSVEGISAGGQGKFSNSYEYYINAGNGYISFRSKNQFIKILAKHGTELNKFIRKNELKINDRHPESIIAVLKYFDKLK